MSTETKNSESAKVGRGVPLSAIALGATADAEPSANPKNIIVRNKAGLTRRARKSELKWFADRGFVPVENQKSVASSQKSEA